MQERVFYRVSKSNEQNFQGHYILRGKRLKEFSVHRNASDSDFYGLYSEEYNNEPEMIIGSSESMIDVIFSTDNSLLSRKEESIFYKMVESTNQIGRVYPRIYRPLLEDYESRVPNLFLNGRFQRSLPNERKMVFTPYNKNELISSINQLKILTEHLETIFLTVHPEGSNLKSYGNNIRNLLILACTEVEAQFKGVMEANKYIPKGKYLYMSDYAKAKSPLRLEEYSIKLINYPWINSISPFTNWQKSLKWYENYNAVKHNRVKDFKKGTLNDAIIAVCAVAVLLNAQYGKAVLKKHSTLFNYFELTQHPFWKVADLYIPPLKGKNWQPKSYLF